MRRRIALWAVIIFALCFQAAAFAADSGVRAVTLTWAENPQSTQVIRWQTPEAGAYCYLEYRLKGQGAGGTRVQAKTALFSTDQRDNFIHTAALEGLEAGAVYEYRIGDGSVWVKEGRFATGPAEARPFKFLLFSDSQSYDYRVWQKTFETACAQNTDAAFYAVAGDLVDNGQQQREWDGWFDAVAKYAGNLSLVPVVGNHETYTPERQFSLPRYFTAQFKLPQNGPDLLKGQAYSFSYGGVHFAVLDTQFGEERGFVPDSLQRQQEWLRRDLAAAEGKRKIILMHRPAYHNRLKEQSLDAAGKFLPIFDAYDVDVVFSGHDHVVARTAKLKDGRPSPQGTVYVALGRAGTKTYDTVGRKGWNVQFFNPVEKPVFYVVYVETDRILVKAFESDGTLLDQWEV